MKICIVARRLSPPCPAVEAARTLARLGHDAHLILAPGPRDPEPSAESVGSGGPTVHLLSAPRRSAFARRRARRAAIGRLLDRLAPQVVHLADESEHGLSAPAGAIVLQGRARGPAPRGIDASVTPDGRFLDRSGLPIECPGVPPLPSASPVDDGLDPEASAAHWRVLTYLAAIDQIRRTRRVRLDPAHAGTSPRPRPAPHVRPVAADRRIALHSS